MASRSSDIWGAAGDYGITHCWRRVWTAQVGGAPADCRYSVYRCQACDAPFTHRYDMEPNIFAAMHRAGVPEHCPGQAGLPGAEP